MDEGARAAGPAVDPADTAADRSPEEIRADIERTRAEVGDTVEALAAKTDVKSQAKRRMDDVKDNVRARGERLKTRAQGTTPQSAQQSAGTVVAKVREHPAPVSIGAAVVAGFLLGRLTASRGDDA
jgi:ElaB/YqjD/DUF883 family membrane-anchored ribosome-binding protein